MQAVCRLNSDFGPLNPDFWCQISGSFCLISGPGFQPPIARVARMRKAGSEAYRDHGTTGQRDYKSVVPGPWSGSGERGRLGRTGRRPRRPELEPLMDADP